MKDNLINIRQATLQDIPFLVETITAAEKSGTDKFGFATLFDITEEEAQTLITRMLEEEIDGCELSVSSFLIAEKEGKPIGAFGGWIEAYHDTPASGFLKSNLLSFYYGHEKMLKLREKNELLSSLMLERTKGTLQMEYMYVVKEARGLGAGSMLIEALIKRAMIENPQLEFTEIQLLANNIKARNLYERCGFTVVKSRKTADTSILRYIGGMEKIIMTKQLR